MRRSSSDELLSSSCFPSSFLLPSLLPHYSPPSVLPSSLFSFLEFFAFPFSSFSRSNFLVVSSSLPLFLHLFFLFLHSPSPHCIFFLDPEFVSLFLRRTFSSLLLIYFLFLLSFLFLSILLSILSSIHLLFLPIASFQGPMLVSLLLLLVFAFVALLLPCSLGWCTNPLPLPILEMFLVTLLPVSTLSPRYFCPVCHGCPY